MNRLQKATDACRSRLAARSAQGVAAQTVGCRNFLRRRPILSPICEARRATAQRSTLELHPSNGQLRTRRRNHRTANSGHACARPAAFRMRRFAAHNVLARAAAARVIAVISPPRTTPVLRPGLSALLCSIRPGARLPRQSSQGDARLRVQTVRGMAPPAVCGTPRRGRRPATAGAAGHSVSTCPVAPGIVGPISRPTACVWPPAAWLSATASRTGSSRRPRCRPRFSSSSSAFRG